MIPIIIQIRKWLMQPKVWRFVGFGSAVVGLVCYALSSSFNYLFGNWNMLKIFLYIVFSFIICMMILFAKILQYSRSLKFKAHTAFLVLTITSVYSFFFDKVVNGKPDAYSLISCVAFAIMSLSLSRQTECGFEVDLLYFFLGCFTVQLMKIKLQLFFLGAGFSYSLIILRSSFSTVDSIGDNQYLNLQDGNSVVLHMDSLQLASTNIATTSDSRNSIDSQQLVISTDIGSMIEKLGTYVKALQHQNSNLIQMLVEHVKKYVEEHSQLVVTDSNFMMDALKPETIKGLEETAKVMLSDGFEKEFSDVYNNCRRDCLNECLELRLFGLQKLNIEDIHSMPWKDLENHIEKWIKAFNVAVKILFPGERRLCDRIFFGYSLAADFSFMEICKGPVVQFLDFADSVAKGSRSPERLFKMLEVFETLRDLIPDFEALFCDKYSVSLRYDALRILKRLGETIRQIFVELEKGLINSSSIRILETNFNAKSKFYDGAPSLGYIFLMNNDTYIVHMTKDNELGTLLGNDWIRKHVVKVWNYVGNYKKTMGTISPTLVQDLFQSKSYDGDVQQLLQKAQLIGENPTEGYVEGSEGSKGYEGYVQEIEASTPQPQESRKKDQKMRAIVISPAPHFGNEDKMAPKDGFTWRKYGKKDILDFKYPRSYYRCSHMKACQAKKHVQQLGVNPNIFEVRYNGGHTCSMSLKLPERQLVNISKDMTQTTMSSSTSEFWWLSAGTISSIPDAKLAAPADGGHHPMMDNVVGYLISAIRSQQRNAVDGDGAFSSAETEGTMELLESILAAKSEKYADPSLRHFFMMNNWRYLEIANKRRDFDIAIFGDVWYQKNREKVQQELELYQKSSWHKVWQFLKFDIIEPMEHNIAVDLMKERLNLFNMHFTETCRIQCTWSAHDYGLRTELIRSLKNILLPAYGIFIGKFQDFLKNSAYEYIEYGMFDIHDILDNLFLGNKIGRV